MALHVAVVENQNVETATCAQERALQLLVRWILEDRHAEIPEALTEQTEP